MVRLDLLRLGSVSLNLGLFCLPNQLPRDRGPRATRIAGEQVRVRLFDPHTSNETFDVELRLGTSRAFHCPPFERRIGLGLLSPSPGG